MHNVVTFPRDDTDPVFFRKHQLRVGTALRYYGRTDPGGLWFVTGVYTTRNGRHVPRTETFPQTLADLIRLENHHSKKVRLMSFQYLSYSALYRVEDKL